MQNYSHTRLATVNHRHPFSDFPEGKGGEERGGGVRTQASVLAILWTSPSFAVNVMLAISLSLFLLLFF